MYAVYAIYNSIAEKIYIGQTYDVYARLQMHNDHTFHGYTSRYQGLWILIHIELVETRTEALRRERQLKSYRGREFVKKHIPV